MRFVVAFGAVASSSSTSSSSSSTSNDVDSVASRRRALTSFALAMTLAHRSRIARAASVGATYAPRRASIRVRDGAKTRAIAFPRARMDGAFATLLLRSAYDAFDECDVMAMDAFQATQWKFRANEWERYRDDVAPPGTKQGDIEDAAYFDFASFAQFGTFAREIPNSSSVFEERRGVDGEKRVVRRDASLRDNARLPEAVCRACGKNAYARLKNGFDRGEDFAVVTFEGVPAPVDGALDGAVEGIRALANVFVAKGYALKISVSEGGDERANGERNARIRIDGPATLWSARELISRGYFPTNDYFAFTVSAFLEESNIDCSYSEIVSDSAIELEFRLAQTA